jgi:hypothetical protein
LKKTKDQINCIQSQDTERESIELARKLMFNPYVKFNDVKTIIKELNDDAEKVRMMMVSYATTVALGDNDKFQDRALILLDCFSPNYYSMPGMSGLVLSTAQFIQSTSKTRRK